MRNSLLRIAAVHAIRFLADSQQFAVIVLHAGWVLLALATWGTTDGPLSAHSITAPLVRAFVWLGGVDEQGHGDAASIMQVWGKFSLVLYLLGLLVRKVRGERPPLGFLRVCLISGSIALGGWLLALWPTPNGLGDGGIAVVFALLTTFATAWGLAVNRLGELMVTAVRSEPQVRKTAS